MTDEHAPWIKGVIMPMAWNKMYGKGRVFLCLWDIVQEILGSRKTE